MTAITVKPVVETMHSICQLLAALTDRYLRVEERESGGFLIRKDRQEGKGVCVSLLKKEFDKAGITYDEKCDSKTGDSLLVFGPATTPNFGGRLEAVEQGFKERYAKILSSERQTIKEDLQRVQKTGNECSIIIGQMFFKAGSQAIDARVLRFLGVSWQKTA